MDPNLKLALDILCYIFSALLGLAVGSFLNVCIYRLPRGTFFSKSRSFCPKCGAQIKAYDNIPLLSYMILRGKCRACHEPISPRYPIIEALNMILWIVNYAVFGMNYITIVYDILVSTMIVVAMVDIDTTEILDSSVITIIILGLLTFIPIFDMSWKSKLIGAFCISVPMLILALFGGMGLGDVKLFFALGLLFGWEKILLIFLFSFIIGSVIGVTNLIIIRKRKAKNLDDDTKDTENINADSTANLFNNSENTRLTANANNGENIANFDSTNAGKYNENILSNNVEILGENNVENNAEISPESSNNTEQITADKTGENDAIDSENTETKEERYDRELSEKLESGRAIPFGPSIVLAGIIVMYAGDAIIELYKGLIGF